METQTVLVIVAIISLSVSTLSAILALSRFFYDLGKDVKDKSENKKK